jgi:hypothetical protein
MEDEVKFIEADKNYQIASNYIMYNDLNIGEGYCEFERYNIVGMKLAQTQGVINQKDAMELLEDVSIAGHTQWLVVYNQATGSGLVCMDMKYDRIYDFWFE